MKRLPLRLLAATKIAVPDTSVGQDVRANPYSGCFFLELTRLGAYALELEDAGLTGAPLVEFIVEPGHAWEMGFERMWRLEGPARARSIAFWWVEDEELVAVWAESGIPLEMRLTSVGDGSRGTTTFAIRPPSGERSADPCRTTIDVAPTTGHLV
jgi:hypothetical protein